MVGNVTTRKIIGWTRDKHMNLTSLCINKRIKEVKKLAKYKFKGGFKASEPLQGPKIFS